MNKVIKNFKRVWKKMLIIFFVVAIGTFALTGLQEKKSMEEGKIQLVEGKVICFDITTFNYLGDGTASVYDYTQGWTDSVLLDDCIKIFDQNESMEVLAEGWSEMDTKTKKNWITENITVQRFATSTMYSIAYSTEANAENKAKIAQASHEMLDSFVEYAVSISRLTDENIEYKIAKEINNEEEILPQNESAVNYLLYAALSVILGIMAALTYFGIVLILNENKKKVVSEKEENV